MLNRKLRCCDALVLLAGFLLSLGAVADEQAAEEQHGTAEEAQALVAKAIAYYDDTNVETAFAAFNNREGEFVDHDLYIFVYGPDRTIVSHGADVELIGTPVDTLVDINGKPFGTAIQDEATEEGVWVDYTWFNPVGRQLHPKSSWIVLHDGYRFGAGIYLDDAE
ncbi:MAG TPA: cache domain-containing protein [Xanthomonadales bacterium]|nr:cache domain-containing protein [Xanthomonadales bacterium]